MTLENSTSELESFKTRINLSEYAASRGYQWDRKESSRNSVVMRLPQTDDKIVISRGMEGHWIYFSVRDRNDSGTIVDFISNRYGLTLGQVRGELRPWIGLEKPEFSKSLYQKEVLPVSRDRGAVIQNFARMSFLEDPGYLYERGLRPETLRDERFHGMIRQDERHNVIFPHYDRKGLSGFEKKNRGFTGFSSGGEKAVWHSRVKASDTVLVLTESAIDALSYHQIHPNPNARYMSLGGEWNPQQRTEIIPSALQKMQKGSTVVLAFDNDAIGEKFAKEVEAIAPDHVKLQRAIPPKGRDWNDYLQSMERAFIMEKTHTPGLQIAKGQ